jgi:hypothetical protein
MLRKIVCALSLLGLAGCESPHLIMTTSGLSSEMPTDANGRLTGHYAVLKVLFDRAQDDALKSAASGAQGDAALYAEFAKEGMAVVDDNCSDVFTTAGEHEKYIAFAKDVVAFTGTLASGVLALTDSSKAAVSAVTLGTTTSYAGLDIYTKNFLFGAENIDSVRTLIQNALDTHTTKVLGDSSPWTFRNAMRVILDHQEFCRPSAIVALVRSAIKNATLDAAPTGAPQTPAAPSAGQTNGATSPAPTSTPSHETGRAARNGLVTGIEPPAPGAAEATKHFNVFVSH